MSKISITKDEFLQGAKFIHKSYESTVYHCDTYTNTPQTLYFTMGDVFNFYHKIHSVGKDFFRVAQVRAFAGKETITKVYFKDCFKVENQPQTN